MARIAFLYSTVDGHTLEICERLKARLESAGHTATLLALQPDTTIDPAGVDRLVIGASIRYGKHRPEVAAFIARHLELLKARPGVFFSVNMIARKPDKRTPQTNTYVREFLDSIAWKPTVVAIFAGKIDYPRYGFLERTMLRLIMKMTDGPTDPRATVDFTDWDAVDALAATIAQME